ncbi:unnamed protein product, partial [Iphiclides podalirius]
MNQSKRRQKTPGVTKALHRIQKTPLYQDVSSLITTVIKKLVVLLIVVAACSALPFERELTPNAHAIPEYALNRATPPQHQKSAPDTSDLKTDSSLWWNTGYLYPFTYTKFYTPT